VSEPVRLQKVLAAAGVGSRRACEDLITAGRVEVDGAIVRELGVRVDPEQSVVRVDGLRVDVSGVRVYLAFNKPRNVVSTMSDDRGRPNLGDYVRGRNERLFHVGRLDADTEGLILLTNDGELAHRLTHPSYEVPKTYVAEVTGPVPRDVGRRLRAGVELEDGPASVDRFRVVASDPGRAMVEVVLHEGRQRIVRRLLAAVGCPVLRLVRVQLGPVVLGDLRPGRTRRLSTKEVGELYAAVGL
jgi:23S rRNA pseudouridine2605 synthase